MEIGSRPKSSSRPIKKFLSVDSQIKNPRTELILGFFFQFKVLRV